MTDQTTEKVDVESLMARIKELEERLAQQEQKSKSKEDNSKEDIWETNEKMWRESSNMMRSFIEASIDAASDAAEAMSSFIKETDSPKPDNIADTVFRAIRKTIDVQKQALDNFESRYKDHTDK